MYIWAITGFSIDTLVPAKKRRFLNTNSVSRKCATTPVLGVPDSCILIDLQNEPFSIFGRLQISNESDQPILVSR